MTSKKIDLAAASLEKTDAERVVPLAKSTLDFLTFAAIYAEHQLSEYRTPSPDVFTASNPMTSDRAIRGLKAIGQDLKSGLWKLQNEPAIARVVTRNENDIEEVFFITRGSVPTKIKSGAKVANYNSPMGRLAATPIGDEISVWVNNVEKCYEVVETATLRPIKENQTWDTKNTVVRFFGRVPLTISSFRAFLTSTAVEEDGSDLLDRIFNEDRSSAIVIEGIMRNVIEKMGIRDQPSLDKYQDEIFRLPLDRRLAILGPPGSGKTTTLIKRLGQKLNIDFLDEGEKRILQNNYPGKRNHSTDWIMFTPTELLKQYVKEAFNREGIAASDRQIQTWDDYRRDIARNKFNILRTSNTGRYILRPSIKIVSDKTVSAQIQWYEDFNTWQASLFWEDLKTNQEIISRSKDNRIAMLAKKLETLFAGASDNGVQSLLVFMDSSKVASSLVEDLRSGVKKLVRNDFSKHLKADDKLLDKLISFLDSISEISDPLDDSHDADTDDDDDDEEVQTPRGRREEAFEAYERAVRAMALATASRRSVGRRTRNGQIIEWLGKRIPDAETIRRIGVDLRIARSLNRFVNPIRSYVTKIPTRYRRYRRDQQDKGVWYENQGFGPADITALEVDVVLLSILRTCGLLIRDRRIASSIEEPRFSFLSAVSELFRTQILVDEVADFSPIQLACMSELCNPAIRSFFACGDFNQRITVWGSRTADDLKWVFPDFDLREIIVTYRHSRQLHEFAQGLLQISGDGLSNSQLPDDTNNEGVNPALGLGLSETDLVKWLAARIIEAERITKKLPSIAVLVNEESDVTPLAEKLNDALSNHNIRCSACPGGKVRGQDNDVRVFDIQHIKGLEFEGVFFVDIDRLALRNQDLFDKYLYVGATRAATYLGMTCSGPTLPNKLSKLSTLFTGSWR